MKVESRNGVSSRIAILSALVAVLLVSLFGALEFVQVNDLQSQDRALSSSIASYSGAAANYTSSVSELQAEDQSLGAQLTAGSAGTVSLFQSFISHLAKLESFDPDAAMEDYAPNATVVWSGVTQGWGGTYSGTERVGTIIHGWFQSNGTDPYPVSNPNVILSPTSLYFTVESFNTTRQPNGTTDIGAVLAFTGASRTLGAINGTISTRYVYVYQNTAWVISQEDWNFKTFNVQYSQG